MHGEVAKQLKSRVVDTHAKLDVKTLHEFLAFQAKYPELCLVSTATQGVVDALARLMPAERDFIMHEVSVYIKANRGGMADGHLTWDGQYGGILRLTPAHDLNKLEAFHVQRVLRTAQRVERYPLDALAVAPLNSGRDA
jgi:hypothetical protein